MPDLTGGPAGGLPHKRLSSTPLDTPCRTPMPSSLRSQARIMVALFVLLGVTWVFGFFAFFFTRRVRRGVSKGVEDGRRPPALRGVHPRNGHKAVSVVARPQGVEGLGMGGPGETLGSPWIPLPYGPVSHQNSWPRLQLRLRLPQCTSGESQGQADHVNK
jgi:hypothetical protein